MPWFPAFAAAITTPTDAGTVTDRGPPDRKVPAAGEPAVAAGAAATAPASRMPVETSTIVRLKVSDLPLKNRGLWSR
jgi:hypothetical protein